MKKTKHTPGPWKIGNTSKAWNETFRIIGQGSRQVAQVSTDGARNDSDVNLANARLIAAAPELLEALVDLCENMESMSGLTDLGNHDFYDDTAAARKAIAKATRP